MLQIRRFVSSKISLPSYSFLISKFQKNIFMEVSTSNGEIQTMKNIRAKLMDKLKTGYKYTSHSPSKELLMKYVPKTQNELPKRTMKHSFDRAIVPLSTDLALREKYTTFQGKIRIGRLMENVDLFAAWCCVKHLCDSDASENQPFPYVIVTIRVHRIEFRAFPTQPIADIRLQGHVIWVGSSSLEVIVYVDTLVEGKWTPLTKALLLMAARNPTNTGPAIVNAVIAETEEEKKLNEEGERRRAMRLRMMNESVLKKIPSEEELKIIHELFTNTIDPTDSILGKRALPPRSKWMHDATMSNLVFCHPEHRNLHNKIFGGFLIRQALELSWTLAFIYGMHAPSLIQISDIVFYNPVDVGSVLKLYGCVTYAETDCIQVFVSAETYTFPSQKMKNTTSFNFIYRLDKECDNLYPSTYLEAMMYVEGRRHFKEYLQIIKNQDV